ncbi:hypothetical protein C8R44DRAFT_992763 [Mycena epipterygia]|nr:hypothetical protein C8R44DRAFT_992763 [Mycena epipterygia]
MAGTNALLALRGFFGANKLELLQAPLRRYVALAPSTTLKQRSSTRTSVPIDYTNTNTMPVASVQILPIRPLRPRASRTSVQSSVRSSIPAASAPSKCIPTPRRLHPACGSRHPPPPAPSSPTSHASRAPRVSTPRCPAAVPLALCVRAVLVRLVLYVHPLFVLVFYLHQVRRILPFSAKDEVRKHTSWCVCIWDELGAYADTPPMMLLRIATWGSLRLWTTSI